MTDFNNAILYFMENDFERTVLSTKKDVQVYLELFNTGRYKLLRDKNYKSNNSIILKLPNLHDYSFSNDPTMDDFEILRKEFGLQYLEFIKNYKED